MEDRSRRGVYVLAASGARPGRAAVLDFVLLERPNLLALRALGVLAILRIAGAPKPVQARRIVGEGPLKLHQRPLRIGRCRSLRVVPIDRRHTPLSNGCPRQSRDSYPGP